MNMYTELLECVDCGNTLQEHEKKNISQGGITYHVCPKCNCESFYKSDLILVPCETCRCSVEMDLIHFDEMVGSVYCDACHSELNSILSL